MKSLPAFVFTLLLAILASCCPPKTAARLPALMDETVAITDEDGDMHCAGVWVAQDKILTAGHCVADLGLDHLEALLRSMQEPEERTPWSPVGQTAHWKTDKDLQGGTDTKSGGPPRKGVVIKYNEDDDLALISVETKESHPVATLRAKPVQAGEEVSLIGHPLGFQWSFTHGYVSLPSAKIPADVGTSKVDSYRLQLDGAINHGNSGGGAFDMNGELVGICSFGTTRASGLGWYVGQDIIRNFLTTCTASACGVP